MSSRGKKKIECKMVKFVESKTDAQFTKFISKLKIRQRIDLSKFCYEHGFAEKLNRCTMTGVK